MKTLLWLPYLTIEKEALPRNGQFGYRNRWVPGSTWPLAWVTWKVPDLWETLYQIKCGMHLRTDTWVISWPLHGVMHTHTHTLTSICMSCIISPLYTQRNTHIYTCKHSYTHTQSLLSTAWKSSRYILGTFCLLKQSENYLKASMDIPTITLTDFNEIWKWQRQMP